MKTGLVILEICVWLSLFYNLRINLVVGYIENEVY